MSFFCLVLIGRNIWQICQILPISWNFGEIQLAIYSKQVLGQYQISKLQWFLLDTDPCIQKSSLVLPLHMM